MITLSDAQQYLKRKHPSRTITMSLDYDRDWYLFMAVEDPNSIDYDSPWYAVNKSTGSVRSFNPIDQLEKFTEALYNRRA